MKNLEAPVLEINNLTKSYGRIKALSDFSLKVFPGEIFGILGPNGSGKTTTLGILLDILKADSGNFFWFGETPSEKHRQRIGSLLETPLFYPHLSAVNNLRIIADIKNTGYENIDDHIETVGLTERKFSKIKTYSLGMKQRLAIAATLMGNPEVLILDEPTNGLDPKGIAEIRTLIKEVGLRGTTIILASHMLDEVQKVCSHVVVLNKGKHLGSGKVSDVLSASASLELAANDIQRLKQVVEQSGLFTTVTLENNLLVATMSKMIKTDEFNRLMSEKGIYLTHLALRKKSLEKYFFDLLSENNV